MVSVLVGPGTVTTVVEGGAGGVLPGPFVRVTVVPPVVVVSVTIRTSPGTVCSWVVHTTSCSELPTAPWAITPIEATPRR
jgi:hypothetical protein